MPRGSRVTAERDEYRDDCMYSERAEKEKKLRTDTKNEAIKIKDNKFTKSNREKSNILKDRQFYGTIIILYFWVHQ